MELNVSDTNISSTARIPEIEDGIFLYYTKIVHPLSITRLLFGIVLGLVANIYVGWQLFRAGTKCPYSVSASMRCLQAACLLLVCIMYPALVAEVALQYRWHGGDTLCRFNRYFWYCCWYIITYNATVVFIFVVRESWTLNRLVNNNVNAHAWATVTLTWLVLLLAQTPVMFYHVTSHMNDTDATSCDTEAIFHQHSAAINLSLGACLPLLIMTALAIALFVRSKQVRNPSFANCCRRVAFRLGQATVLYFFFRLPSKIYHVIRWRENPNLLLFTLWEVFGIMETSEPAVVPLVMYLVIRELVSLRVSLTTEADNLYVWGIIHVVPFRVWCSAMFKIK